MRQLMLGLLLTACAALPAQALDLRVALSSSAGQVKSVSEGGGAVYREQGLSAVNAELFREVCRRITARCKFEYVLFKDMLPGMVEKRYEVSVGNFLRTPEREQMVNFSDSIATSSSRLVAAPERAAFFSGKAGRLTLSGLYDARLVVVAGSMQEKYLKQIAAAQRLTVIAATSGPDILPLMRKGEADFWLAPVYLALPLLSEDSPANFQFYGPPEIDHGLGGTMHFALTKGDAALTAMVNKALAEIRRDGSYHRIVRQYFPVSLD